MKFRFVKRTEPDGYVVYLTESQANGQDVWLFVTSSLSSKRDIAEKFYESVCARDVREPVCEVLRQSP